MTSFLGHKTAHRVWSLSRFLFVLGRSSLPCSLQLAVPPYLPCDLTPGSPTQAWPCVLSRKVFLSYVKVYFCSISHNQRNQCIQSHVKTILILLKLISTVMSYILDTLRRQWNIENRNPCFQKITIFHKSSQKKDLYVSLLKSELLEV